MIKCLISASFAIAVLAAAASAHAGCASYPYTLTNGTTADANQVMADLNCLLVNPTFSGNVGIGTTSPAYTLDIVGASRASGEIISTLGGYAGQFRMVSGNYGSFFRNDGNSTYLLLTASGNPYGGWTNARPLIVNDATGDVYLNNVYVQASGGNMTVPGAISAGGLQSHNGSFGAPFGDNVMNLWWDGACVYVYVDATPFPFTCPSDRRIKNNISNIPDGSGLSTIAQLHPVSFSWANKATTLQPNAQYGFLAQELRSVLPNLVANTGMKTPQTPDGMLRVDYNGLIAPIVKAIQDLKALNDQQAAEIQALQTQFAAYQKAHP